MKKIKNLILLSIAVLLFPTIGFSQFYSPVGVESTPLIKDVDNDGFLELLVADYQGNITCYATQSKGKVFIGQFRNDNRNTGVLKKW